jgi:toxin ParE1/3/4
MIERRVFRRASAREDLEAIADYYTQEAGPDVALRFLEAAETGFRAIGRSPGTGTPRYGRHIGLPGLRHRPARRFPYLIFYMAFDDRVEVWRVLHAQSDIPAWLKDER